MGLINEYYYFIEAKKELYKVGHNIISREEKKKMVKKVIYKHRQHERLEFYKCDIKDLIKIMYLVSINQKYNLEAFEKEEISTKLFDKWWKLKEVEYMFEANDIKDFSKNISDKIKVDNPFIQDYLEKFK